MFDKLKRVVVSMGAVFGMPTGRALPISMHAAPAVGVVAPAAPRSFQTPAQGVISTEKPTRVSGDDDHSPTLIIQLTRAMEEVSGLKTSPSAAIQPEPNQFDALRAGPQALFSFFQQPGCWLDPLSRDKGQTIIDLAREDARLLGIIFEKLKEQGYRRITGLADVASDAEGRTLAHCMAACGRVSSFIACGGDFTTDAKDASGNTPLDIMLKHHNINGLVNVVCAAISAKRSERIQGVMAQFSKPIRDTLERRMPQDTSKEMLEKITLAIFDLAFYRMLEARALYRKEKIKLSPQLTRSVGFCKVVIAKANRDMRTAEWGPAADYEARLQDIRERVSGPLPENVKVLPRGHTAAKGGFTKPLPPSSAHSKKPLQPLRSPRPRVAVTVEDMRRAQERYQPKIVKLGPQKSPKAGGLSSLVSVAVVQASTPYWHAQFKCPGGGYTLS